MYDKETVEKLGYIAAKVEETHADLKQHITDENLVWDEFNKRLEVVEEEHSKWKSAISAMKFVGSGIFALLLLEWINVKEIIKRLFS